MPNAVLVNPLAGIMEPKSVHLFKLLHPVSERSVLRS